jgi:hypothetical protein
LTGGLEEGGVDMLNRDDCDWAEGEAAKLDELEGLGVTA